MEDLPPDLARRLEEATARVTAASLAAVRSRPGNPSRVEIRERPEALAFVALARRVERMNGGLLLRRPETGELEELLAFFRERGVRPRLELLPEDRDTATATRLRAEGLGPRPGLAVLWAVPAPRPDIPGVRVREPEPRDQDAFAALSAAGFETAEEEARERSADLAARPADPTRRIYVAELDGVPAGTAGLSIQGGVASLTTASTLPALRRRGVHAALLARRISDAARLGCDVVSARAEPGSASYRNIERAGLRLAYAKAVWGPPSG
ncbi:MAG: GNAT family N-acetyltransferase [Planctomycetales bacterium]|nr:GNAT family N-acetyltransferase [Planctomycetales bacterium]